MNQIENILVPIDFSDCAAGVVRQAAQLARPLGARLTLLHVVATPEGQAPHRPELIATADRLMPKFEDIARDEGVEVSHELASGLPAEAILEIARKRSVGMLVMGTHGRTGLRRLTVGSVAESVLRHAEVPVLVVRSIHQPHCEAKSCQVCRSGLTEAMWQAEADQDG